MFSGLATAQDAAGIMLGTYPVMLTDTAGRWWGFLEIDAVLSELDDDVPDGWWSITGDIVLTPESPGIREPVRMMIRAVAATMDRRRIHLLVEST
jgi:hypothetical protein